MADIKRKILYVITKSVWGGAQRYVYDLATHLPHEKFEAMVVCGGSGLLAEKLRQSGIRVIAVPNLKRDINPLNEIRALFWLLKTFIRERPDVIHLNSSKIGGLGAAAARLASLVTGHWSLVVFTVHGWAFNEDRPRWQKKLIFLASRLASWLQDRIIVINSADWRAAKNFIPVRKLRLITHGVRPASGLGREEARREVFGKIELVLKPEETLVGTVAEITRNKGLEYLIESLNILKRSGRPTRVLIIGDGEDKEGLQNKVRALGLKESVHFAGFIPEVQRLLAAFDVFVLPSVKEGLPYAIMEAMAAGLPVVATAVGGIPDLIEDGKNGFLVTPKNPGLLTEAVGKLIDSPTLRDQFGQEARAKIEKSFTLERMTSKTVEIYSQSNRN